MFWGALIGVPLGLCNLVVGLKLGLGVGVALTAVGFAGALRRTPLLPTMGPEDAALLQSVASAAGYSAGSAVASVLAAMVLAGVTPSWPVALGWTLGVALFGTALGWAWHVSAVKLPFPSATAAAEAIKTLWKVGAPEAPASSARPWLLATGGAVVFTVLRRIVKVVPSTVLSRGAYGLGIDLSALALGVGMLLGLRVGLSTALTGVFVAVVEGPWLFSQGQLGSADLGGLAGWNVWPATALITAAAVTHLLAGLRVSAAVERPEPRALLWSLLPGSALGLLCVFAFGAPLWAAALVVLATPLACVVSIRMTGETDATPGAPLSMGLQLLFGAVLPFSPGVSIASAGVLAGASASAADLVSDVKTGTLVGLAPRRQLVAQLIGCVVGALVAVPAFLFLAKSELGGTVWPAPAAQMFLAAGRAASGAAGLGWGLRLASVIAAVVGVMLALLERRERVAARIPSPMGMGLALLVPPSMAVTIGVGALLGFWARKHASLPSIASGLMVGESVGELTAAVNDAVGGS